jgi:hypothetical protein
MRIFDKQHRVRPMGLYIIKTKTPISLDIQGYFSWDQINSFTVCGHTYRTNSCLSPWFFLILAVFLLSLMSSCLHAWLEHVSCPCSHLIPRLSSCLLIRIGDYIRFLLEGIPATKAGSALQLQSQLYV